MLGSQILFESDLEENNAGQTELEYYVPNYASVLGQSLSLSSTASVADTQLNFGPLEMMIDLPISVGCFTTANGINLGQVTQDTAQSPVQCLTACLDAGLRFGALKRGTDCHCLPDLQDLANVPTGQCTAKCTGSFSRLGIYVHVF